jgi:dTDP-4-amino-4,6-dideoxygalactose transaminase
MTAEATGTAGVPFLDLKAIFARQSADLARAFDRVCQSGWYILGDEVQRFEEDYAAYCGAAHAIGVANGLEALSLSLRALGIGPGDDVLVPSNTYIATWLAVTHVGANPVPVEPCPDTCNMDPARLEVALTARTRAVMPVHLYGQPADLDPILAFARARSLAVVEDGAQAHGARYRGKTLGAHGHAVAWSFYPGKNLGGMGDGGAITTDDAELAARLRTLRNYGSARKYHNDVIGWNSRLDELQAALLRVRLPLLDADNARRRAIAARYLAGLGHPRITLPVVLEGTEPVWHLFVIRHPDRAMLQARLAERGISTMIHYPVAPHRQPAYAALGMAEGSLPISEALHREVLSLPIGPTMSDGEVERVIEAVLASA